MSKTSTRLRNWLPANKEGGRGLRAISHNHGIVECLEIPVWMKAEHERRHLGEFYVFNQKARNYDTFRGITYLL